VNREGRIINVDDADRGRCPDLAIGERIAAEDAPDLHERLSAAHTAAEEERARLQDLDVMDVPESQRCYQLAATDHRLHNLSALKSELFKLASEEIMTAYPIEAALPDVDLTTLH
jgi:hypothetical protein